MKGNFMRYLLFGILLLAVSFVSGQSKIPPERPKLVIGIVVDQMRYDYLTRYWDKFGKGGFKRLVQEGTVCNNTNLNYLFTQTAVGHASIFTGATPSVHGIVSNDWYSRTKKVKEYCCEDKKAIAVGGDPRSTSGSPRNLMTSTIGDELKLFSNGKSKVFGISMKDRAAILSAGRMADAAYWYDDYSGEWMSSSYYMDTLPKWVKKFNKKDLSGFYLDKIWEPLLPMEKYIESLPDVNKYETGIERTYKVFPYDFPLFSVDQRKNKKYGLLRYSPFGNTYTKDFALAAIDNENLGKDEFTDMLIVSFSPTDYLGHYFGPRSIEVEDAYLRIDQEIEHFLVFVDDMLGKENVLVFLTSDHGVSDVPQYLVDLKSNAGIFKQNYAIALLKSYLNALYGEGEWITEYIEQQIFLNHELIEKAKIPLDEIQRKAADFVVQFSGVSHAITASTLTGTNFTEGIQDRIQNSYYAPRCGDILISLMPGYIEDVSYSTTHNSAYSYDTHIPLIWYGWKIKRNVYNKDVEVTDIAPTISTLLKINFPDGSFGKPIPVIVD